MNKLDEMMSKIYEKLAEKCQNVAELPILRDYMAELESLDEDELAAELADCENSFELYRQNS